MSGTVKRERNTGDTVQDIILAFTNYEMQATAGLLLNMNNDADLLWSGVQVDFS